MDLLALHNNRDERKRKKGKADVPLCNLHRRRCKRKTVKKEGSKNRGRNFFVCPLKRVDACDTFIWEAKDDEPLVDWPPKQQGQVAITFRRGMNGYFSQIAPPKRKEALKPQE